MSNHRSDILENMAPALAPESSSRRDSALRGVWSYRDGALERLVWHGREEQGQEVESAIETAVWLFEERHQEGDRKTVETDHGTAVLERGTQGVVVAWYEEDEEPDRTDASEERAPRRQEQDDGRREADSVEPRRSDAATAQNTTPKEPVSIDLAESQPPVDRSEQQASGRSRTDSPARSSSEQPHQHSPVAASSRHARPGNVPEGSRAHSGTDPDGQPPSDEFHVQISFADDESNETSEVDSTTEPTCRWADVEDHLNDLTEMACEHLGSPVVMNYWRDVIEEYDTIERQLDIELYGGIETHELESTLEDETMRQLETARRQWLERCQRSLPADAALLETPPDPPWRIPQT